MFTEPNSAQKIAIQFANTRFCVGANRVANRLEQLSEEIAETRRFCEQLNDVSKQTCDRLHEQLNTLKSQCKESAKLLTALKDQSIKASTRVYRPLINIDAAMWQLPGLINSLDSNPLWIGLPSALESIRLKVLELKGMLSNLQSVAVKENNAKVYTWPLFVYVPLALLSFVLFSWAIITVPHMEYSGMTATLSVLSLLGGFGGVGLFAVLATAHVEAATPYSDGFNTPTKDADSDAQQ